MAVVAIAVVVAQPPQVSRATLTLAVAPPEIVGRAYARVKPWLCWLADQGGSDGRGFWTRAEPGATRPAPGRACGRAGHTAVPGSNPQPPQCQCAPSGRAGGSVASRHETDGLTSKCDGLTARMLRVAGRPEVSREHATASTACIPPARPRGPPGRLHVRQAGLRHPSHSPS